MSDRRIESARSTTRALALALTSGLLLSGCEALIDLFFKVVLVGLVILAVEGALLFLCVGMFISNRDSPVSRGDRIKGIVVGSIGTSVFGLGSAVGLVAEGGIRMQSIDMLFVWGLANLGAMLVALACLVTSVRAAAAKP